MNPESWMRLAIAESRKGYPAPNPHVGCVIVQGETLVGRGFHEFAGGPHAEIVALLEAGGRAKGADAYVSLEPCNHHGRTPPCSMALRAAGVRRVFYAIPDPYAPAAGGAQALREAGIETVELGELAGEAFQGNRIWLTAVRRGRPYIVGKAGISLDGRIALESGESQWITGEKARRDAQLARAEMGAVLVGRRTVAIDDPKLTVRVKGPVNQPIRLVVDPTGRLGKSYRVFNKAAPTLTITGIGNGGEIEVEAHDGSLDLDKALRMLYKDHSITGILIEGGAKTMGLFLEADMVDELRLYMAPKVLLNGPSWASGTLNTLSHAPQFSFDNVKKLGPDIRLSLKKVPVDDGT